MSPSQQFRLSAVARELTGKKVRRLRHEGKLPAVVYGHGTKSSLLALDAHEFDRIFTRVGRSHLVDLSVDGGRARKVLVKAVQKDPRRNVPSHVDLYLVRMTEKLHTEVPVIVTGESPAVKLGSGEQLQVTAQLRIECLPGDIPDALSVDASRLAEVGDAIRVSDLALPDGVAVLDDPDEVIVKIQPLRDSAAEEAAEAAEAAEQAPPAEPAEGGEGEGAGAGGAEEPDTSE